MFVERILSSEFLLIRALGGGSQNFANEAGNSFLRGIPGERIFLTT